MRPPAWRLQRDLYRFFVRIQTRYRDQDMLQHVNNIALAAYYDEARHRFSHEIFGRVGDIAGVRIVTADSHIHFLAEVFHPDDLEIATGILRIGNASYQIGQALFQNGRCAGTCTSTFVQATKKGSGPIPDKFRAVLEDFLIKAPSEAAAAPGG